MKINTLMISLGIIPLFSSASAVCHLDYGATLSKDIFNGPTTCDKGRVTDIEVNGPLTINGTVIEKVVVNGPVKGKTTTISSIKINGTGNFVQSSIGELSIYGVLTSHTDNFNNINASGTLKFTNSNVKGSITMLGNMPLNDMNKVYLYDNTIINGDIKFENYAGNVYKVKNAQILGKVINGKIINIE
jgi:cytoskeletal protein CcmA (bactofilin family)